MAAQQIFINNINPLLRLRAIEQAFGKSRATLYRDINKGLLTKPVQIGGGLSAWPASEVEAITKARIAGKTEDEIRKLVGDLETERQHLDSGAVG